MQGSLKNAAIVTTVRQAHLACGHQLPDRKLGRVLMQLSAGSRSGLPRMTEEVDGLSGRMHRSVGQSGDRAVYFQVSIAYAQRQWPALLRFTEHGFLNIDNNASERAPRAIAVGRKNWLFAGSDRGGHTAAILYTMTQTCKRHRIDPFVYLRDVLSRLPRFPVDRLTELSCLFAGPSRKESGVMR